MTAWAECELALATKYPEPLLSPGPLEFTRGDRHEAFRTGWDMAIAAATKARRLPGCQKCYDGDSHNPSGGKHDAGSFEEWLGQERGSSANE